MDFKSQLALYRCLSLPISSDSEVSSDEAYVFLVDPDSNVKENNLTKDQTSKERNRKKDSEFVNSSRDISEIENGSNLRKKIQKRPLSDSENLVNEDILFNVPLTTGKVKKRRKSVPSNARQTKETSNVLSSKEVPTPESLITKKTECSKVLEKESYHDYEASEDCSTDNESDKPIKPTRKKRTASGSSTSVHVCPVENCGKEFNRPWRLAEHQVIHTGERPHKCTEPGCNRTYTRKQYLQRHISTAHRETEPREYLKCDECGMMLKNKYNMAKHFYRAHIRENYKCDECGQTFRKQNHLRSHSYQHTGVEPYGCEYPGCGARFLLPSKLRVHALKHLKKCYACPNDSCAKTFDVYNDLQKHLSVSHPKVCDVCGRKFRQLRQLRMHRMTHESVREAYFCPAPNCDRYFYVERSLTFHYREKHEGTLIYQCSICFVRLSSKQKLAFHMTTHDPQYQRNYTSQKPRKARKDKGSIKRDLPRLLSGFVESGEDDDLLENSSETLHDDSLENSRKSLRSFKKANINADDPTDLEEDLGEEENFRIISRKITDDCHPIDIEEDLDEEEISMNEIKIKEECSTTDVDASDNEVTVFSATGLLPSEDDMERLMLSGEDTDVCLS